MGTVGAYFKPLWIRNPIEHPQTIRNNSPRENGTGVISEHQNIIVTGGGTGGHVFPAISISKELLKRGFSVLYVGSSQGMEATLVPKAGIDFFTVKSGAIKNQGLVTKLKTLLSLTQGILCSFCLLRQKKPVAIIGVGGYVSVPVVLAAVCLRIPIYLQEQNVSVGIANRILGRFAKRVFLGFPQAEKHFPKGVCINTGNPIRSEFSTRKLQKYNPSAQRILIMGGSQGARAINQAIMKSLPELKVAYPSLTIIHQTGKLDLDTVLESYAPHQPSYTAVAFIDDVFSEYEKASLVICRAGAITVSELVFTRRPAIFVPYPRRGQNDQVDNARFMEDSGVARVVEQGDQFPERLLHTITEALNPGQLSEMFNKYSALQKTCALVTIADRIERDINKSSPA